MEVTGAHLRYLLAIYEISQQRTDVGASEVARSLNVSRPSVTRMLGVLMDRGLLMRERYGKIYLTDQGLLLARQFSQQVAFLRNRIPLMGLQLSTQDTLEAACLLAACLPASVWGAVQNGSEAAGG